jgi:histidinol phosphatase-like PHP family hydrolase
VGELYPAPALLHDARAAGVGITFASDAHEPGLVGDRFDSVLALAADAGYDTVTVFDGRSSRQAPIG